MKESKTESQEDFESEIEFSKNKSRAKRRYINKIIKKRNAKRAKIENCMGYREYKPYEDLCALVPSSWKRIRKRQRKAKVKQAMRNNKEIPKFKRDDEYDWW